MVYYHTALMRQSCKDDEEKSSFLLETKKCDCWHTIHILFSFILAKQFTFNKTARSDAIPLKWAS